MFLLLGIGYRKLQSPWTIVSLHGDMFSHFYRAMHYSAKRSLAIACRLSVRLSVCL